MFQYNTGIPKPCADFRFEFAIDGKITSWTGEQLEANKVAAQRMVVIVTVLDDENYTGGEAKNVELAIRVTGCGREKPFGLTHIYWA